MKENILTKFFMYLTIFVFSIIAIIFLSQNYFIFALLAYIIVMFISLKLNIKRFPIFLFIISFLIRLLVIVIVDLPQQDDIWIMLDAAKKFAVNDYSFGKLPYFSSWGYQTGFVIYEGIILKIFKSEFVLKFLNIIFTSLTTVLIYFLSKKFTSEKSAKVVSLLYMVLPMPLLLNTLLNNHILSALLTYFGITFIIKNQKTLKDYIFSSILIAIGNILRPEGIIVVFSLIIFEIIKLKKDTLIDVFKKLFVFLTIYVFIGSFTSFIIQKTNVNPIGLKNNNPLWKFVIGFNHDTCGYYDHNDEQYFYDENAELEIIKDRVLTSPLKLTKLFTCKINYFWLLSEPSSGAFSAKDINFMNIKISAKTLNNIAINFNIFIYIITLFMCFIGVILNKEKIIKNNSIFFIIMMVVTFFVYLLIELRVRYTYFIIISIFILSSYGYDYVLNQISKLTKKEGNLHE